MLDLNNFETFCSRLWIQPRDEEKDESGKVVVRLKPIQPFCFNPSQRQIMLKVRERQTQGRPLWLIFLKARRLGISTWSSALLVSHCIQKPMAKAMIVAQLTKTA